MRWIDDLAFHERLEWCEYCDRETKHEVSLDLRTASSKNRNAEFARGPHRTTQCGECGAVVQSRM